MPTQDEQIDPITWLKDWQKRHQTISSQDFEWIIEYADVNLMLPTLAGISGYLQMLTDGELKGREKEVQIQLREAAKEVLDVMAALRAIRIQYKHQHDPVEIETKPLADRPKVLHFEDDSFMSDMYALKFTAAGMDYSIYSSPTLEPVSIVLKERPDLILMDVLMPEMDGFQATAVLKADERTKGIPIIFLTNLGQDDDVNKGISLGATDYIISADLTPDEVVNRVRSTLHLPPIERVQPKGRPIENQTTKFSRYQDLASDEEINKRMASHPVSKGSWIRKLFQW